MNKQIRNIGVLSLVLVGVIAFSGGAYATAPPEGDSPTMGEIMQRLTVAQDPEQEFAQLAPSEQEAVAEYLQVARVIPSSYIQSSADEEDCWTNYRIKVGENLVGITLWRYISRTYWCWDGSEITNDPHFTREAQTHVYGWQFVGHLDESTSGGQGEWEFRDYTQGYFKLCFPLLGCTMHRRPTINKVQRGDGTSDSW